ncbi:hypothetical protein Tco_0908586 [Tanacetum coccineum]|uniref:Uncharacterized protein n=1 Tax=Tanacetum coccineum TaxID=301880 RepID=A0ABQ5CML5_9ASTR
MLDSEAYQTYLAYATGEKIPKPKYGKNKADSKSSPKKMTATTAKGIRLKTLAKAAKPAKKKQPTKISKAKGLTVLSEVALTDAEQMKLATKRSLIETHSSHASGSGADEGTGSKPRVPDVPTYGSNDEKISWKSSDEEDDDEVGLNDNDDDNNDDEDNDNDDDDADNQDDDYQEDDGQDDKDQDDVNGQTDSDNDADDFVHHKLSTHDQEVRHNEEESDEEIQGVNVEEEELDEDETNDEDKANELYKDVNVNSRVVMYVLVTTITEPPLLSTTTLPPPPTPLITHLQQTLVTTPETVPSSSLQDLPNFGSLFGFDHRLKTLETNFSELKQTNQFAAAASLIPSIVDAYLANKIHEAVKTTIQLQSNRLRDETQAENEDFLNKLDDNIKKIIKEQVKAQLSKILPKIEKTVNEQLKVEVLTRSSNESKTSHAIAANLSELELKKILIDKMESNKPIHRSDEQKNLYKALDKDEEPSARSKRGFKIRRAGKEPESTSKQKEKTSKITGKSTEGSKSYHKSVGESAQAEEPRHTAKDLEEPAHLEFEIRVTKDQPDEETSQLPDWFQKPIKPPTLDHDYTPLDFLAFVMNRLKVDTLTSELLAGPTFELMKGSCKSLVELEYFFEEVYRATIDQLDWNNPKGQQYPHDLRKPLPLIPNSRVMKTKAADYGNIKWIEDLLPNTMESARYVYSKRRIIVITKLQIVKWHNYKHLDWITVRRDDDKLYKFKEGNFNRLRIQDIEDMLLLLVQGKLTNLTIKECLAFGVSLRMFTRSVVIQRRVEDLQLGVESYQKKLNLTKPDTYISNLKRREALQHTPILEVSFTRTKTRRTD